MTQNLFENWSVTKEALTDGLAGNKKVVMESVLENTKSYLSESAAAGSTMAGNIASLNKVILPVIRRVMPTVIANELVGVQPMTGPTGITDTTADNQGFQATLWHPTEKKLWFYHGAYNNYFTEVTWS